MPKEEWGTKRMCPHCGARFYDLKQDPMTCPACQTEFTAESLVAGRGRMVTPEKTATRGQAGAAVIETDDDTETTDADGDLDDDLLEDDDEDADVSLEDIADVAEDTNDDEN